MEPKAQHQRIGFLMSRFSKPINLLPLALVLARVVAGQTPAVLAGNQESPGRPLWGELSSGPYQVGFRSVFKFDTSRTWRRTRDYAGKFTPDPNGRPVQINVWYPAAAAPAGERMTFGAYVDQKAPQEFAALNSIMRQRSRESAESSVSAAQLPALLATPMNAYAEAKAATGRFPVALYFGGLNADVNSNVVLAEFLSSHGYVVASVSLIGPVDQQTSQSRTPSSLDATVRDMEFALGILHSETNADATRLALLGHSLGAVEAVMFAMRNGNVSDVIGLDGTYGFKGSAGVLTGSYGFEPGNMRAAFLDLRRAQGEQEAELDLTPVRSLRYSNRILVTLARMHHSDFTSFAMVAFKFAVPIRPNYANTAWNRGTAQAGYQQTCRLVLQFLNEKVNDVRGLDRIEQTVRRIDASTFTHLNAGFSVPSPQDTIALANTQGLESLKSLLTSICGEQPLHTCIDASLFNTQGYELLGQHRAKDAVVVFRIVAWSHPLSANAQDSLADGYLAIGDKESARKAMQLAIALVPDDSTLDSTSKVSFLSEANKRLNQIR